MPADELEPTPSSADPGTGKAARTSTKSIQAASRPAGSPPPILQFAILGVALLALAVGILALKMINDVKATTQGGFNAIVDGLNKHVISGINAGREENATASKQLLTAMQTYQLQNETSSKDLADAVLKTDARVAEKIQPILSRIGVAVTDQVASEIERTNAQRIALTEGIKVLQEASKGVAERLAAIEEACKASGHMAEETRASLIASNTRIKDAIDKISTPKAESSGPDLGAQITELAKAIDQVDKRVALLQSKIGRGF